MSTFLLFKSHRRQEFVFQIVWAEKKYCEFPISDVLEAVSRNILFYQIVVNERKKKQCKINGFSSNLGKLCWVGRFEAELIKCVLVTFFMTPNINLMFLKLSMKM